MHPGKWGHYYVPSSVRRRYDRPGKAQVDSTAWVKSGEVAQLLERERRRCESRDNVKQPLSQEAWRCYIVVVEGGIRIETMLLVFQSVVVRPDSSNGLH